LVVVRFFAAGLVLRFFAAAFGFLAGDFAIATSLKIDGARIH